MTPKSSYYYGLVHVKRQLWRGMACVLSAIVFLAPSAVDAQRIPLTDPFSDYLRAGQVTGDIPARGSWMIRPVTPSTADYEQLLRQMDRRNGVFFRMQDVRTQAVFNSHFAHGINQEAVFPGKGLTSVWGVRATAGVGPLRVQLDPTVLYAQNQRFAQYPFAYNDFIYQLTYIHHWNLIDRPVRYRNGAYARLMPGNSEVSLRLGNVEVAGSSSTLWWGPGQRNSLLLTNNAEGFVHATVRSRRPVRTIAGNVEFQAIWGRLENSEQPMLPPRRYLNGLPMPYIAKVDDWRVISGLVAVWEPRWTPGFYVGAGRTIMGYAEDVKGWDQAAFAFFRSPFEDQRTVFFQDPFAPEPHKFDDKFALFLRYVAPVEQFEIYGEWGRNNRAESWADFFEFPEHGSAFVLGMNKFFPIGGRATSAENSAGQGSVVRRMLRRTGAVAATSAEMTSAEGEARVGRVARPRYIRLSAELTNLEKTQTWRYRYYPAWYQNHHVRHGYTHRGQVLGAGIGPGSNAQFLGVDYLHGRNRVGIFAERVIHNNDLYYILFTTTRLRHWVDLNFGVNGAYHWGPFSVSGTLTTVYSMNYMYIDLANTPGKYKGYDPMNLHVQLDLRYRF
jgi:hypothetical protein